MMAVPVQQTGLDRFDHAWIEDVILKLGDFFNIRVVWERETALVASACALAGGLVGAYAGGRVGAAVGAGLGSVAGVGVSALVSLREVWAVVREQARELIFVVLNYLRRLDAMDYVNALQMLAASFSSRQELALTIVDVLATKLGREVLSSITAS